MAERLTIARPYAKAVFAHARDTGRLAAWSERLGLAATISADARVRALYGNPRVGATDLVTLFMGVGGTAFDEEAERLLAVLAENGRLQYLPEIAAVLRAAPRRARTRARRHGHRGHRTHARAARAAWRGAAAPVRP